MQLVTWFVKEMCFLCYCMHSHHLLGKDDGILCVICIGGMCLDNDTFANGLNSMCVYFK